MKIITQIKNLTNHLIVTLKDFTTIKIQLKRKKFLARFHFQIISNKKNNYKIRTFTKVGHPPPLLYLKFNF